MRLLRKRLTRFRFFIRRRNYEPLQKIAATFLTGGYSVIAIRRGIFVAHDGNRDHTYGSFSGERQTRGEDESIARLSSERSSNTQRKNSLGQPQMV
jgi:hypothetical protein